MTDQEFTDWLVSQSALRCILVEAVASVASVETTRYLSTIGYTTSPTDSPANQYYTPRISGGVEFTETISQTGKSGLQFGDIEIANDDGEFDGWLDDVWVNRAVTVYIGDSNWPRADFRVIFSGIIADIDTRSRDVLNLKIRDKLQRLNKPLTDVKLEGATSNADRLIPITFGECFNIKPLLTNAATHEYQFHDGASEGVIEVRDNGVVVSTTNTLATGKFTLTAQPAGEITASIQGDKPSAYNKTVSSIIQRIVLDYGHSTTQFVAGDLDASNLSTFEAANTQAVGVHIDGRMTVFKVIQDLANSIGAQVVMSREGLLQLIKIELPALSPVMSITADQMLENNISITGRSAVVSSVKLGYCKNYTVQQTLQTGIPEDHKDLLYERWLTETVTDATTATAYKLSDEPVQKDTYMLKTTEATTEANRLLTLNKTPRTIYRFTGFAEMFDLRLGDTVTLTHHRFGLSGGENGMVVELRLNWITNRVSVGVLM